MTKIDIFSGFLGAGKTTLIKKLIREAYRNEKVVLIENEFGEIGVDGGFLAEAGIEITEMNSGCICCSLVGDFSKALAKVLVEYRPDRILIEPSGVGKLSDVIRAVRDVASEDAELSSFVTVVDAAKCRMYLKNFGEFFGDQIEHAGAIILSHTKHLSEEKVNAAVALCREHNKDAVIVTTDWDELTGEQIKDAMERRDTLDAAMEQMKAEQSCPVCGHHHHEHHHHEHGEHCDCHEHHHDHHGHHHADEVFVSFGAETAKAFCEDELRHTLAALEDPSLGTVLRAKGIVAGKEGWIHFDYVPGESDVRTGAPGVIGRLCVIGAGLDREKLSALFGVPLM